MLKRHGQNPLVRPGDVRPSSDEYEVVGAFNPGAVRFNDEIILLMRVAERCPPSRGVARIPIYRFPKEGPRPDVLEFDTSDPDVELKDTRSILYKGREYLSSMSHLRLARSRDGIQFSVSPEPTLFPDGPAEAYGLEDARISRVEDTYYINFTVVSRDGWSTALASTKDFTSFRRLGIVFHPENKDASIFPEKIGGKYFALHRPNNSTFGKPSIWISESEDLLHWGNHRCILTPRENEWEAERIGGGPPPIKTERGWLEIYHGAGQKGYALYALLMDLDDPARIVARGSQPLFVPQEEYERKGFFGNVVFCNGAVEQDGKLYIYYGAADETCCLATATVEEILSAL